MEYFDLMKRVGTKGKYQNLIFGIFFTTMFMSAVLLMGTSFLFMEPKLQCKNTALTPEECEEHICSLPKESRTA